MRFNNVDEDSVPQTSEVVRAFQGKEGFDRARQVFVVRCAIEDQLVVATVEPWGVVSGTIREVVLEQSLHILRRPGHRGCTTEAAPHMAILVDDIVRVA